MITAFFHQIETKILSNLKNAKSSIKVAVAWFTNPLFYKSIIDKLHSGVNVELILADDRLNFLNPSIHFQEFIDYGGTIHVSKFPNLMHHKFCIIDERILITGSYNWTKVAEVRNYENIIISTERALIDTFILEFARLKNKCYLVIDLNSMKFKEYVSAIERKAEYLLVETTQSLQNGSTIADEVSLPHEEITIAIQELIDKATTLYHQQDYENAFTLCNKISCKMPNIPDVYVLMAKIKWRQSKYKDQIKYALKAVDLDNRLYEGFNVLAIGYSNTCNDQKSIEMATISVNSEPLNYTYRYNRALAFLILEEKLPNAPINLKNQWHEKALSDLRTTIKITTKTKNNNPSYSLFFIQGFAWFRLGYYLEAKKDLLTAVKLFNKTATNEQDMNEFIEIKDVLAKINKTLK